MVDPDRKKRADAPTVKSMKSAKGAKRPTEPELPRPRASAAPSEKSGPRPRKTGRRGGLVEEVGERVRRDPRREND